MLTNDGNGEAPEDLFKSVAEAAWAVQDHHNRFLFKKARPADHPSRVVWATANQLWWAQVQARKSGG